MKKKVEDCKIERVDNIANGRVRAISDVTLYWCLTCRLAPRGQAWLPTKLADILWTNPPTPVPPPQSENPQNSSPRGSSIIWPNRRLPDKMWRFKWIDNTHSEFWNRKAIESRLISDESISILEAAH